ncbi:hypothetical protein NA56DRAFT_379386 [Hyaloscypha hepaticicola]|uniref:Uncharacterized protein n=1 Tax=Hyaloscypha hepaticicola TaxID=2082293 RepID=A0A2J6QH84_9HELO|nr:hypothetical protein NA56DRAFT_379386 [Hyaloscypha hepaticicola]
MYVVPWALYVAFCNGEASTWKLINIEHLGRVPVKISSLRDTTLKSVAYKCNQRFLPKKDQTSVTSSLRCTQKA